MKKFQAREVDNEDELSDPFDAYDAESAAEAYADQADSASGGDLFPKDGADVEIEVRDVATGEMSSWHVTMELEPVYRASRKEGPE